MALLTRRVAGGIGEEGREWEGKFWDQVFRDVGGGEARAGGFDPADVGAFDVEAIAEEAEYLFDVLFEGPDDVFSEELPVAAVLSYEAPGGLGLVEAAADFVDEGAVGAEVDGALSAGFAPGESVVGSEAAPAVGAPGGDDGALSGEAVGVVGEEADGWVVGCTCDHAYMIAIRQDFSIGKLNIWGGFLGGGGVGIFGVHPESPPQR
ncbi:MAG: hypothetical protein GXX96_24840 [Planctomycetaceae bacterium]|nr:hypothetical protein [Planctomycetaceae bacterium]